MSREPNWYQMGFEIAEGTRKSLVNLPAAELRDISREGHGQQVDKEA